MTQELLKQRIKYLVEHGGVIDDPHADAHDDIRNGVRKAWRMAGFSTLVSVMALVVELVR
jgi:3-deoxy-D-arabino-heptulosonate 7-phosphate (DAHP) synthase